MRCYDLILVFLLALGLGGCSGESSDTDFRVELDARSMDWIGEQIFHNECAGREACLVHWNEGEAFPSLGIGHFIWYPAGVDGPFVESFPAMVAYLSDQGVALPRSLSTLEPFAAPWPDREVFRQKSNSPQYSELQNFLASTKGYQVGFILQRANRAFTRVVEAAPATEKQQIAARIRNLIRTPGGVYALIDYVNFKGEGLASTERYDGEGWGLLQVLQGMESNRDISALQAFRESAARVLSQRAGRASAAIERERWLPGWLNRLETYREPK